MMRRVGICLALLWLLTARAWAADAQVLWQEDFETLDAARWNIEEGWPRNGEPQQYTPEGVTVADGCLVLNLVKGAAGYTSGSVHTAGKLELGPNTRLEVRARVEGGYGAWPAIWLHASRFTPEFPREVWPAGGEIDMMEAYGTGQGFASTVHLLGQDGRHSTQSMPMPDVDVGQWHRYALEWEGPMLRFYVDDICYWKVDSGQQWGFNPFFHGSNGLALHLNLAVLPGQDPGDARFFVDEVRLSALGEVHPCAWIRLQEHEVHVPLYSMVGFLVDLDPAAQDRTVCWQVDSQRLEPVQESTVKGYYYAAARGETVVTVTTPSGCTDRCRVVIE